MKKNTFYLFILGIFFIANNIYSQVPANNDCTGAQVLAVGAVPACGAGNQTSGNITVAGNITSATPGNPYIYQTGCVGSSATQSFPANDVWYKFVATGYHANITVASTFATPNISFYSGSCAALGGGVGGCSVGSAGAASLTVDQLTPGTTYFIQISGGVAQTGTFNLTINNTTDCTDCLQGSTLSVNPLPVNGAYAPGTTVNFCYHVVQYNHVNTNWLHGVQLTFGSGWNPASVVPSVPTSTSTGGSWAYYPAGIGVANAQTWNAGWYWDDGLTPSHPIDNFGDPAVTAAPGMWNFCVNLTTAVACTPGSNLSVTFNTSGDGESGSWSNAGCATDGSTLFHAIGACCPPAMSALPLNCNGVSTGSATATPVGVQNPYTYNWTGPAAYSSSSTGVAGANTISNVAAGVYTVQIIDKNLCAVTNTVLVTQPTALAVTTTPVNASCAGVGSITTAPSGGTPAYTYTWTGPGAYTSNAQSPAGLTIAGIYTLNMSDSKGCTITQTVTIASTGTVTSTFTGAATQCLTGNSFTFNNTGTAVASHSYSFSPAAGAPATSTQTNYIGASFTTAGTYTVSHTVTSGVCVNTTTNVVVLNPMPVGAVTFTNPTCGLSNGVVFISNISPALPAQTISTYASSLGTVTGQTVTGLGAGSPVITLTNNFGCTFTISPTLIMIPGPTAITTTTTSATCGLNNGSFTFGAPTGGTPAYSYAINGGVFSATSPTTGLAPATYSVTVKDINGCVFTKPLIISNIAGPTALAGTPSPANCAGPTGSYTVTGVTGGTAAYTYSVDGGAFSGATTYAGLASGTHSVTVKDLNGCTFSTTFNVGVIAGITSAIVNASTASCGTSNATATVSAIVGGVPTYSYSYDGGGFTAIANTSGLAAGNHTVIIKDVNTCTLSVPYTVISLGSPTTSITSFSNVTCFGLSNGSCTVAIPTGGAGAPFTYTLTAPFQSNGIGVFSGLPVGSYNISVKDVAGCIATTTVTITQPTPVVITATATPAKCFGTATGTITLTGSGGTPTYSYNLNGGAYQGSSTFANQFAGIYTMGIKDANGCLSTQTVQITQPTALAIVVATQNANCTAANGVATTTVSGGTPIYTYTWTGGGGAAATSNSVVAGSYTVTVTDANGCVITSAPVIGLTPGGTAAITASTNVTCNGANNGSMTTGMTGGAGSFSYSWTPGGQTVATAINLSPGTYTCTVTDFFGCKATAIGTIIQPPVLTAIMNSNNVKCFGGSTGTVTASGSGGVPPYAYLWTSIPSALQTVNNVAIGNYPCNITDANGCVITQSITVTQPTAISLTSTVTSANCNQANGSATITATGGAPGAYTYTWSAGSNAISQGSVVAGTYTITVQDANNCLQTLAATIPNLAGPVISITSQTNVSCFGGTNGVATTSVSGGVSPYIYSWSSSLPAPIATNLAAGLYTVSATDAAGCVASTSVNITQPTALTVNILPTNPKCFGAINGSAIAAALGGTPSYTYAWTSTGGNAATTNPLGAGNYGLTVTDGHGCVVTSSMVLTNPLVMSASITSTNVTCFGTCNGIATAASINGIGAVGYFWTGGPGPIAAQTVSGLCVGSYTVLATDQNNCTASAQITITEPTAVTANISATGSVTCNGGNNGFAAVTAGGGTGVYSYAWSPSGGNTANANTLTAGVYTVTVKDANLCSVTAVATIIQPTPLSTTLTTANVKCNGACDGTGNVAFLGGTGTTTFSWQPGLQNGNFVNNLCAGNQTVTITSNGTCTSSITFTLTEPVVLTAATTATNSNCGQNNGKACATVAGGTAPLNSIWSNGPITLCNNNIVAGAYSFTVTDANGCIANASGLVNDIAGPVVSVLSQTNISCFGGANGAATTTITGGVPTYSVSWTDGQLTQNVNNFTAGIKNITVVDAAGCVGTASVNITQPTQLVSAIGSIIDVTCNGLSNGGATMLVNGGTTPYTYTWTPSAQTSSVMANVTANSYTANVTDGNGCLTSQPVTIAQPQALVMTASSFSNVSCFGGSNGQISTTIQGGTPGYTYSWTPVAGGAVLGGLTAGGYSLTVVDAHTCSINANFNITEPSVLTSNYTSLPATCGLINGSAAVTIGGGTPTYSVVWNTPGTPTGTAVTNVGPGSGWIANITDSKGCTLTQTVSIANPPVPVITGFVTNSPKCFGLSNGDITINYTAGTGPYTVIWSSPISQTTTAVAALTQNVAGVASGVYTATLTDFYGCTTTQPVNVTQPGLLVLLVNPNPTICFGETTQLNASGQNGTPAYTYTWSPNPLVGGGPHTVNPTVTTTYTVAVSDVNGCSPSPKIITVNVTPQLLASGFLVTKCDGDVTTLTPNITSPGRGAPYDFTWSTGLTQTAVSTSSVSVVANFLSTPNTYTVLIDDGCTIPTATAIFTVNVNPNPTIDFTGNPRQGCAPLTVTLTGTSNGPNDVFTWTDNKIRTVGSGNPYELTFVDSGKYSITLSVNNPLTGCSSVLTKTDYIEVYAQPIASFFADPQSTSILDPNINFINTSQGATTYFWDFGDPAGINGSNNSLVMNPSHGYTYVGEYAVNLVATSIKGCKDTARIVVEITPDFALYIPNTFTPDGNGLNDVFQPLGVGIDEDNYRMDIFDRWGENIFSSNNFRKGWDGTVKGGSKTAEQGVYTYKIMVRDIQGNKHPKVGHVTVIGKEN